MIKVGITGGIGVGKSFVCKIFSAMGTPIYNADYWAKYLMDYDLAVIQQIKNTFGEDIYTPNNKLKRSKLAQIVFSNEQALHKLNNIVHPAVFTDSQNWFVKEKKKLKPYVIKEAALLYENESNKALDKIIVVSAPLDLRISRVISRNGWNRQQVLNRIDNQLPQEQKEDLADYIIFNDEEKTLLTQIWKIHQAILKLK